MKGKEKNKQYVLRVQRHKIFHLEGERALKKKVWLIQS